MALAPGNSAVGAQPLFFGPQTLHNGREKPENIVKNRTTHDNILYILYICRQLIKELKLQINESMKSLLEILQERSTSHKLSRAADHEERHPLEAHGARQRLGPAVVFVEVHDVVDLQSAIG